MLCKSPDFIDTRIVILYFGVATKWATGIMVHFEKCRYKQLPDVIPIFLRHSTNGYASSGE
jgi:hypothetical protein